MEDPVATFDFDQHLTRRKAAAAAQRLANETAREWVVTRGDPQVVWGVDEKYLVRLPEDAPLGEVRYRPSIEALYDAAQRAEEQGLTGWAAKLYEEHDARKAQLHGTPADRFVVGETAFVYGFGHWYVGIVTKVAKTRVSVFYRTGQGTTYTKTQRTLNEVGPEVRHKTDPPPCGRVSNHLTETEAQQAYNRSID